jgi:hypothetical protein
VLPSEGSDAATDAASAKDGNDDGTHPPGDASTNDARTPPASGDAGACARAGTHRLPGTMCCPGDDNGGTVRDYELCCRPPGGACDLSVPNPDAFCCQPQARCNRTTGTCEARVCWEAKEQCRPGIPCCNAELTCQAMMPGSFGTCCRPDGMIAQKDALGNVDCCSGGVHSINNGPLICGPKPP